MANITKFLKKGEKQQKTKTKTFRLTENAYEVLEELSKKTKNSQNEIMNEILDDYYEELCFSKRLTFQLEKLRLDQIIILTKKCEYEYFYLEYIFNIKKIDEGVEVYQANYQVYKGDVSGSREMVLNYGFDLYDMSELYTYGLNINFKKTIVDI